MKTFPVLDLVYRIIFLPDPARDVDGRRCKALIDHPQYVLWLDPGMRNDPECDRIILEAIELANKEMTLMRHEQAQAERWEQR